MTGLVQLLGQGHSSQQHTLPHHHTHINVLHPHGTTTMLSIFITLNTAIDAAQQSPVSGATSVLSFGSARLNVPAWTPAEDCSCPSKSTSGEAETMLWSVPERSTGKVLRAMGASVRVCFFAAEVAVDPGGETTRWNIAPGYIASDPDPTKARWQPLPLRMVVFLIQILPTRGSSTTVPILVASSSSRCNHIVSHFPSS
ncbi:hypothetical protein FIBSPDRAFT_1042221 [Athelia psychrophila]|uniref:Uncharacterized protein n=1 Tax=Athelia psychrophila TaxID=1759441 RepID=A0A166MYL0_9AGAM|nr:hypothetical protein FIBSPDRAFT_1042221 [Fibularhizoctonia sp. CBS 109695]